jgi:hypothetical protein
LLNCRTFAERLTPSAEAGTFLTYVSLIYVDESPLRLRRQADHCRNLAHSQFDERVGLILRTMATEFEKQADDLDAAPTAADRGR